MSGSHGNNYVGAGVTVQYLTTAIGVRSPAGVKDFPLASVSRPALRPTQPPIQWVPGVLSPRGKARPVRDADQSPI
jgi:hypothetical protein